MLVFGTRPEAIKMCPLVTLPSCHPPLILLQGPFTPPSSLFGKNDKIDNLADAYRGENYVAPMSPNQPH